MTPLELRELVEKIGGMKYFFDHKTMAFFGDSMKNYGVADGGEYWELYRKNPVKGGLFNSTFFDKKTFKRVYLDPKF